MLIENSPGFPNGHPNNVKHKYYNIRALMNELSEVLLLNFRADLWVEETSLSAPALNSPPNILSSIQLLSFMASTRIHDLLEDVLLPYIEVNTKEEECNIRICKMYGAKMALDNEKMD